MGKRERRFCHGFKDRKKIGEFRKEKGMVQEQLAQALGVSAPAAGKWETGVVTDIAMLCPLAVNSSQPAKGFCSRYIYRRDMRLYTCYNEFMQEESESWELPRHKWDQDGNCQ